jgi:hypothetical protein
MARSAYVSPSGHRCTARRFLEFDHIDPVARGGRATADHLRLRCRAHNQLEAERIFGVGFMRRQREASIRASIKSQSRDTAGPPDRDRRSLSETASGVRWQM